MSQPVADAIEKAVSAAFPDGQITVTIGTPGHFSIEVVDASFAGQNTLTRQRRVYATITELMAGHNAPVHAIDQLVTRPTAEG